MARQHRNHGSPAPPTALDLTGIKLGPCRQQCSDREQKFAYALGTGLADNPTEAARQAGYESKNPVAVRVRAYELISRDHVVAAIRECATGTFSALIGLTVKAAQAIVMDPLHADHAKTVMSILSRLGFTEKAAVDVNLLAEVKQLSTIDKPSGKIFLGRSNGSFPKRPCSRCSAIPGCRFYAAAWQKRKPRPSPS
jgi:hypothetical protein